ncbi:hypothetical protein QYF61_008440 [Mycteria americana]|uniref:Uncharacterized protein n=1 Tax=Mycteria americana TaxID=33587 RepID=A0AAN7RSW9_MYCAM|nr:hypothetical protein QYF61_008440 [Mycteria americana]
MCPVTGYQGEELSTSLSTSPPQKAVESNEVAPQPPFLPTRQTQSARPLLTGHAFQPFHQLCCPPLDAFKDLHILLKLWGPELPTALQGWRLNHFPGQPVPMLDNPFREVKFPNIQSKPPLAQLEAISSHPITCYLGEETDPHLSTTSLQVVVESHKVSPQPPFLQAKQPQLPQPLPIRLVLQTLHQLRCPSLDTLQPLNVFLVVGGPKLNTVFEVRPHQC